MGDNNNILITNEYNDEFTGKKGDNNIHILDRY